MNKATRSKGKAAPVQKRKDDFESVANRLECDMDDKRFREKLGKIARAKPSARKAK